MSTVWRFICDMSSLWKPKPSLGRTGLLRLLCQGRVFNQVWLDLGPSSVRSSPWPGLNKKNSLTKAPGQVLLCEWAWNISSPVHKAHLTGLVNIRPILFTRRQATQTERIEMKNSSMLNRFGSRTLWELLVHRSSTQRGLAPIPLSFCRAICYFSDLFSTGFVLGRLCW